MRRIRLSEEEKLDYLAGIATSLNNMRMLDSVNMVYKPKELVPPSPICLDISPIAYLKMRTLVEGNTTECAWQGTVEISPDRHKFTIKDIFVYPQTVTGATVNTDDEIYDAWHQALDNDTYNTLRFQGHSHVSMGVAPSPVDKTLYNDTLQTLRDDSYYIFMIMNKRDETWVNIYDLAENAIYEKTDLTITIGGINLEGWGKEQKKMFTTRPVVHQSNAAILGGTPQSNFEMPDRRPIHTGYNHNDYLQPIDKRTEQDREVFDSLSRNIRSPFYASDSPEDVNAALTQECRTGKADKKQKNPVGRPAGSRNR